MPARPAYLPIPRLICVLMLTMAAWGMLAAADPAAVALEQLRATNQARAELARTESTWQSERQRLSAIIEATRVETARLERDAHIAEAARNAARERLAALGGDNDLDALRTQLATAGERLASGLTAIARTMPPGTVPAPSPGISGDGAFDLAVRSLESAERATNSLSVEVITGTRDGHPEAVKVLRVAGAAAWWVALDGSAAGVLRMADGQATLLVSDEADRIAILAALAQAEGRGHPTITVLPGVQP